MYQIILTLTRLFLFFLPLPYHPHPPLPTTPPSTPNSSHQPSRQFSHTANLIIQCIILSRTRSLLFSARARSELCFHTLTFPRAPMFYVHLPSCVYYSSRIPIPQTEGFSLFFCDHFPSVMTACHFSTRKQTREALPKLLSNAHLYRLITIYKR